MGALTLTGFNTKVRPELLCLYLLSKSMQFLVIDPLRLNSNAPMRVESACIARRPAAAVQIAATVPCGLRTMAG
jgi:hypothetical protein